MRVTIDYFGPDGGYGGEEHHAGVTEVSFIQEGLRDGLLSEGTLYIGPHRVKTVRVNKEWQSATEPTP